ncbi:MAG: hypothetical protein K1X94_18475 [Sandaracinaceae bacterium]|nr:hypothetical protein [Sandaracinaceae bacterium]
MNGRELQINFEFSLTIASQAEIEAGGGYVGYGLDTRSDTEVNAHYSSWARGRGVNVAIRASDARERTSEDRGNPLGERSHEARANVLQLTPYALDMADGGARTAAHEIGHVLGLSDRYDRATNRPEPDYGGNIMANGAHLMQEQIDGFAQSAMMATRAPDLADQYGARVPVGEQSERNRPLWREWRPLTNAR